jgi:hypothetical protein
LLFGASKNNVFVVPKVASVDRCHLLSMPMKVVYVFVVLQSVVESLAKLTEPVREREREDAKHNAQVSWLLNKL